jgi:TolB-like protein
MEQVEAVAPRRRGLAVLGIALVVGVVIVSWRACVPRTEGDLSLAVLPFESRGAAPGDGYLAPGIEDELTSLLSRLDALRVLPRSSTQRYAGAATPVPQIGRELGVSYLLKGGAQRTGDLVRVDVALWDAAANRELWQSSYERRVLELFPVEGEVARAIVEVLTARRLSPGERAALSRAPTPDPAAYDAWLRARGFMERNTRTEADLRDLTAAFEDVVRLDPEFAPGWAQLSRRHSTFYSLGYDRSESRRDAATRSLETAERLGPDLIDTKIARAYYLFVVAEDLEAAERAVLELEARNPSSSDVAVGLAQITREMGRLDRSTRYARRAVALDPLNAYRQYQLCQDYLTSREIVLAVQTCDGALDVLPGDVPIIALEATIRQTNGEIAQARRLLRGVAPEPGDWRSLRVISRQFELERNPAGAAAFLGKYLATPEALGTRRGLVRRWFADAQRQAGDGTAARASYETARAELEAELALQPSNPQFLGELAIVRARLGDRDAALDLGQRCMQFAVASRRTGYIGDCGLARIQVALATNDTAGLPRLVEEALKQRGALPPLTVSLLRVDPEFDDHRALVRSLTPD